MATNWNSTKSRALAASLAFFLGVTLTVGSLGTALGRLVWDADRDGWWEDDWQESQAFRNQAAGYLEDFLTIGAGGTLDWYNTARAYGTETVYEDWDSWVFSADTPIADTPAMEDQSYQNPDYYYENDKNVLYRIYVDGKVKYDNLDSDSSVSLGDYTKLPDGYNFLLFFQGGQVSIVKDGKNLDVYGDGIYDEDAAWFVPGYENFPAGKGVEDVAVYMAVRETPAQYLVGDYENGGVEQSCRMYWLYQDMQQSRSFYLRQAVLLSVGLLWLAAWFFMRKDRAPADRKIASWTVHIWTEVRFLAVGGCLLYLLFGNTSRSFYIDNIYDLLPGAIQSGPDGIAAGLSYLIGLPLSNIPAVLALGWTVWLIWNDHRYNSKEARRSLGRLLRGRELAYTVQKRLIRQAVGMPLLLWGLVISCLLAALSVYTWYFDFPWFVFLFFIPLTILVQVLSAKRSIVLAKDIGLLADQVEAIRGGDLEKPLVLPADADLRETAEHLNDIQAGLHTAMLEQTRSERMKVELISNVSHDLKTPLTSILSYAELLRQEPLEGAAADYARIIDEKAQRLKSMVQDVFEVSKAAACQLPVQPERLDFAKLLRQTLADMEAPIEKSRLTFKVDLPERDVFITADGKRLYRVFQNLIQNTLQYALEGSRVYLTLRTDGNMAIASLRNTSRNELPEGVDFTARFVRGDESRTDGGSGLGLSIASSFTEACGGAFRVETVADLFTAVVEFPITE